MHPIGRFALGGVAVFVIWTLVRAWRRGRIFTEGAGFSLDEQPVAFVATSIVHLLIAGFGGWCALGYDPNGFFAALGFPENWKPFGAYQE